MELRKPEETIKLLRELATAKGDDFRVRIMRKRSPSSMPESVATFDGATVEQLTQPEAWLPQLAGGGPEYILSIYHANDKTELLGALVTNVQGEVRPADTRIVGQPNWTGPRIVVFPRPPPPASEESPAPAYSVPIVSPGTGGAVARTEPGGGTGGHVGLAIVSQVQAQYEDIDRRKKRLADEEKALAERQKNMEVEAAKAAGRAEAQRLERDLADARAQAMRAASTPPAQVQTQGESLGSVVERILPTVMKVWSDARMEDSRQRLELTKMQMENQRDLARIQQAAQDKLTELMLQNANRPLIPPELKDVIFKDKDEAHTKMMSAMSDTMGTMVNMTMNVLGQVAEMNLGGHGEEEGGGALKLVREGLKTVMAFTQAAAARKAAQLPPGTQQRQLPDRREMELRRRKAQLEAQRRAAAEAAAKEKAAKARPVPESPPAPTPVPSPAPAPAPAFAGISPADISPAEASSDPAPAPAKPNVLDDIISLIRDRAFVPDDVAAQILQKSAQDDGSLQAAVMDEYDGSFAALFADRLGDDWLDVEGNTEYLDGVIRAVAQKGVEAGIFDVELLEHLDELTSPLYEEEGEGEGEGEAPTSASTQA